MAEDGDQHACVADGERMKGRRCLVTGAASGIGRAIADAFAAAGARVAALDRDGLGLRGLDAVPVIVDLADPAAADDAMTATLAALGGVDVLVNAAGISRILPAAATTRGDAEAILAVNLLAPMALCAAAIVPMRAAGGGCIINLASELALVAQPGFAAYCASKGGLLAYTRALALECAPLRIRVNAICPGPVDTPMLRREFAASDDPGGGEAATVATMPVGRLGEAEEIAAVALFLATAPGLLQGAEIVVDGGKTLV